MAITISKQKTVSQIFTVLGRTLKPAEPSSLPVLEQFLYAICRENATREAADQAFEALRSRFFDWNEVRVTSADELTETLQAHVSQPEIRAQRIIDFLQEVFETTFSFDLEALQKKGVKLAAKTLSRYQAANDYTVAWVVQQTLDGHAIPIDSVSLRVLRRLGLLEDQTDMESMRGSMEHQVPKAKGSHFVDLISELAESRCWQDDPGCFECPLRTACPTGQAAKATATTATSKKPR